MNIINPLVSNYLDGLYRPLNGMLAQIRAGAEESYIPIITKDVETFLAGLLVWHQPKRILEIGTAVGYSAAFMATKTPGCKIDTIENKLEAYEIAMENLAKMDLLDQVVVHHGDGLAVMTRFKEESQQSDWQRYDMVFVDASKSQYRALFDCAMELIKPDGIIVCDNVLMRATVANDCYDPEGKHRTSVRNMRNFIDYIVSLDTIETAILPIGDGISMSVKK